MRSAASTGCRGCDSLPNAGTVDAWRAGITCPASRRGSFISIIGLAPKFGHAIRRGAHAPGAESASRRTRGSPKFSAKSVGWGTWIRTKINGVRVRCSTVELSPKALGFAPLESWDGTAAPSAPNVASRGARYHLGHRRRAAKTVCAVGRSSSSSPFARGLRLCRARLPSAQSRWSRRARPGGPGCRAVHEPTDLRARWRALPSRLRCGRLRHSRRPPPMRRCRPVKLLQHRHPPRRPPRPRLPPTHHRPACRRLRLRHPLRHRPHPPPPPSSTGPLPARRWAPAARPNPAWPAARCGPTAASSANATAGSSPAPTSASPASRSR